jgi:hypothetical protein
VAAVYVKSGSGVLLLSNRTWSVGEKMVPIRADTSSNHYLAKGWVWECTTGGTSTGTPTWPASVTQDVTTVTQNGVIWKARKPGFSSGTTADWSFATIYMDYGICTFFNTGGGKVNANVIYVSSTHAEVNTAAVSPQYVPVWTNILSVSESNPSSPSLAAGASITATSFNYNNINMLCHGISFISTSFDIQFVSMGNVTESTFINCTFWLNHTNSSRYLLTANSNSAEVCLVFKNCTFRFGHTSQGCLFSSGVFKFIGGGIHASSSQVTSLITGYSHSVITIEDFDLSPLSSTFHITNMNYTGKCRVVNSKLPANWSGRVMTGLSEDANLQYGELINSDNTNTNYRYLKHSHGAATCVIQSETTIVRTGGATNGTTPISLKGVTDSSYATTQFPIIFPPIIKWNSVTGRQLTATIELITNNNITLTDTNFWIELSYLGTSGLPLGLFASSGPTFLNAANLTSSSATWVTTGLTNPIKQKVSLSFTPQMAGFVSIVAYFGRASTTTYVDPYITITG